MVALHLPFRALENIELKKWIRMISFAPAPPKLLNSKSISEALLEQAVSARQTVLERLPTDALMSTALDCWQSPNKHSFMAITG